ncbi:MAG: hypothetical protein KDB53_14595 [Planctomycetes bacterium]|nr:hypothetical protein [Planctomycetota bacterium]
MRSLTTICLLAALCSLVSAQTAPTLGYGEVTHANVRVRAGMADYHADLDIDSAGFPIEITGWKGDWAEVRMPGGIVGFVHQGRPGRPYIEQKAPGRGLVLVTDLLLRPRATQDWPDMGRFQPNQDVVMLGSVGTEWYRVLAPDSQRAYIYRQYVRVSPDQAAAREAFDRKAKIAREDLLQSGEYSRSDLDVSRTRESRLDRLATIDGQLEALLSQRDGLPQAQEFKTIRERYLSLAKESADDPRIVEEANRKAVYVQGKEEVAEQLAGAEARVNALAERGRTQDIRYTETLSRYREEKTAAISEKRAAAKSSKYLQYGLGTVRKDVFASASGIPTYILSKASEDRYYLSSLRYDLSEYVGREIGITGWKILTPESTDVLRRVQVTRLEVLD